MNRTQKWQKIAENRLIIMNGMEKQNDALEQQNRDLVAALEDALAYFRHAHEHECTGWGCAECYPQLMAAKIDVTLAIQAGE